MANFTEIFAAKAEDMSGAQKVEALQEIVTGIRTTYGNLKVEIEEPLVHTADGQRKISYLSSDDQVAAANVAFNTIKNTCIEAHTTTPGMMLDKEIESLVAVDPTLCNLGASVASAYL